VEKLDYIRELIVSMLFGVLGRAIHFVRHDARPMGFKLFLYEIPIALGFGIIGGGIAQWFQLQGLVQNSVMIVSGYIGPRLIDIIVDNLPSYISKWIAGNK
jgi:hypothetical protein